MEYVNTLCNEIHQKMQGISLDVTKDILGKERIILSGYIEGENITEEQEETMGTSLISIMRLNQQIIFDEMIKSVSNEPSDILIEPSNVINTY